MVTEKNSKNFGLSIKGRWLAVISEFDFEISVAKLCSHIISHASSSFSIAKCEGVYMGTASFRGYCKSFAVVPIESKNLCGVSPR